MIFFKHLNAFFLKREKIKLFIYFIFSIITPVVELLSLGSLAALIYFILDQDKFNQVFGESFSVINLSMSGDINSLLFLIVTVFIFKNIFLILYFYFETSLRYRILANRSRKLYQSYFNSRYLYFKKFSRADIFNNIVIESGRVVQYLFGCIKIAREVLLAIFLFTTIFILDKYYSTVIFTSLIFASTIFYFIFNKKFLKMGKALRFVTEKLLSVINETHNLFKMIILNQKKQFFFEKFDKNLNSRTKNYTRQEVVKQTPKYIFETLLIILICYILFMEDSSKGNVKELIPFLSVLVLISIRLLPIFSNINSMLSSMKFSHHSFYNYINTIEELKKNVISDTIQDFKETKINSLEKISIKKINFSYNKNDLIRDLNLEIKKGEIFGIFGKSGSGKSTLVDIISGLIKPNKGEILLNNEHDIFQSLKTWQNLIGYVPQENLLMNDTLKNNVCLGIEDEKINESKLINILKVVGLNDLIRNLKDGLDTNLGESGTKFSGGQKQRIAIARALYLNPKLIIFDEATSALDEDSENQIIEIIRNIKNDKIIILITHDLRLKSICDRIFEIN